MNRFSKIYKTAGMIAALLSLSACVNSGDGLGSVSSFSQTSSDDPSYASLETGIMSGRIGEGLDLKTRRLALETEYTALERGLSGVPVFWETPSGIKGQVIPQQPYQVGDRDCRRYTHRIVSAGNETSDTGTACRSQTGAWTPLS